MPDSFYGMFSVVQMFWLIFRSWETESVFNNVMEVRQFGNYIHSQLSILCLGFQVTTKLYPHLQCTIFFWYWDVSSRKWGVAACPSDFLLPSKRSGLLKHPKEESDLILHRAIAQNGNSLNSHLSHCFQSMIMTLWTDSLFSNSLLIIKK